MFGPQLIKAQWAGALLAAVLCQSLAGILLFDHTISLRPGVTALPHSPAPSQGGQNLHQTEGTPGGQFCG
jgi:hypothetical protein